MEPQITDEIVEISPTNESQENAFAFQNNEQDIECIEQGLEALYFDFRKSISAPRIERANGRSKAIWDYNKSMARVVRKDGKFETFGRNIGNSFFLEYYEALYLMELGRLQLEHRYVVISIEQAYLLLLGETASDKYCEYLAYSYLTRAGYILRSHYNKRYWQFKSPTESDCIWAWLINSVQKKPLPSYIKKSHKFADVKKQIEAHKSFIREQQNHESEEEQVEGAAASIIIQSNKDEDDFPTTSVEKRKLNTNDSVDDNIGLQKRQRGKEKSLLNSLMDEDGCKQFMELFQKFDIIQMKSYMDGNNSNDGRQQYPYYMRNLRISFDLYLHNNGFKKSSPEPPLMRVIVLDSSEPFPNHAEISHCFANLLQPTPILVISVGDAKQIQAYLYFFA